MSTLEYPMLQMELGTLVTRMDVLNRTNLTKLAKSLNGDFLAARGKQQNPSDIVFFFNRTALLFFRAGKYSDAVELSWRAIHFCMLCAKDDRHALGKALQPYVNIGRVKAVRGETKEAVKVFREIYRFMEAGIPFTLGPYRFGKAEQESILASDQPLLTISRDMFLAESLRALLLARDFPQVIAFVEELNQLAVYQERVSQFTLLEAQAIAWMEVGDLARASHALDRLLETMGTSVVQYPAVRFLEARLLAAKGLNNEAMRAIDSGKRCVQELVKRSESKLSRDLTQARYLLALADYLYGVPEYALPILTVVLDEASQLKDEVLDLKARFLQTRIMLASADPTMTDRKQRDTLFALGRAIKETDYQFQRQLIQEYLEKEFHGSDRFGLHDELELGAAGTGPQSFAPKCHAPLDELRNNLFAHIAAFESQRTPNHLEAVSS